VLDAAIPQLCSGTARMRLTPDASDLPSLTSFNTTRALLTANLNATWTPAKIYASDLAATPMSDALVVRNTAGGEYAQFYCVKDANTPREAVIDEFLKSHLFVDLPGGPAPFALLSPPTQTDVPLKPTLTWEAGAGATSWLVEIARDEGFNHPSFIATVTGTPTVTVDHVLPLGKRCYWRVTARNDYGTLVSETRVFMVTDHGTRKGTTH
jgi:hypothetical protein